MNIAANIDIVSRPERMLNCNAAIRAHAMKLLRLLYPFAFCQLCTVALAAATPAQSISILTANATANQLQAYNITSTGPSK